MFELLLAGNLFFLLLLSFFFFETEKDSMEGRKQSLSTKQRHTNRELLCSINVHVQTPIYSRFRQPLDFLPLAVSRRGFASPLARLADRNQLRLLLQVSRKEIVTRKSKIYLAFMSKY